MSALMQEYIYKGTKNSILPCNTARQCVLWRIFQNVCQVFVTDGHEAFIVPSIRLTVAARNLEKQWTWETKRVEQRLYTLEGARLLQCLVDGLMRRIFRQNVFDADLSRFIRSCPRRT